MRLLLIDGSYYAFRAFFAIRDLKNSAGEPTNALFGFLKAMRRMLKDLQPDLAAVIWDEGVPKRRSELQPQYKANRAEPPPELPPQIAWLHRIIPAFGLHGLSLPDTEADDLIASYACAACSAGHECVLATNDKDLLALAGPQIKIYSTNKPDLPAPDVQFALIDAAAVEAKWGVPPECIHDVLALTGDSSDNIPGVPGVGQKTAAGLIRAHGRLADWIDDLARVPNEKLRAKLAAAHDQITQNREMVRLDRDLPLPKPLETLRVEPDYPAVIAELERCEFRGLLSEYRAEARRAAEGRGQPAPPKETQDEMFPF